MLTQPELQSGRPRCQCTLTSLYNVRPPWLDNARVSLDIAVAHAYCWTDYTPAMPDDETLRRLLALNRSRI